MAGIMDKNVDTTMAFNDGVNSSADTVIVYNIKLNANEPAIVLLRKALSIFVCLLLAVVWLSKTSVDGMAFKCEMPCLRNELANAHTRS